MPQPSPRERAKSSIKIYRRRSRWRAWKREQPEPVWGRVPSIILQPTLIFQPTGPFSTRTRYDQPFLLREPSTSALSSGDVSIRRAHNAPAWSYDPFLRAAFPPIVCSNTTPRPSQDLTVVPPACFSLCSVHPFYCTSLLEP